MERLRGGEPQYIGRYRLLARLGEGGMGQVFLARSDLGRIVAVKTVLPEFARRPEFRDRFRREVHAAQRVGGNWTAPVLDADLDADIPWLATGYVAGPSLRQVVGRDHGPMPESSVQVLAAGLARALGDIHAAGLVHRDLKPSNVLLTVDGPRVIDFGIARAMDTVANLTGTGGIIGSPGFMAPEQVRGERIITPACDVFCLGSVLAYAATGVAPFGADDRGIAALMYRVAHEEPDLSRVPGSLLPLLEDCLRKDPAARPGLDAILTRTGIADSVTGGRAPDAWLPAPVLARLGRQAAELLEFEDAPPTPPPPPMRAAAPTWVPPAPPAPTPARRRSPALLVAVVAVLALGGGMALYAANEDLLGTGAVPSAAPTTPGGGQQAPAAALSYPVATGVQVEGSPTFAAMTRRGRVVIGVKEDQPGLGFKDATTGELSGFDIEIARMIAAGLGFGTDRIDYRPIPSAAREDSIARGDVDLYVGTYLINDRRKERVSFAGPYFRAGQGLLVRAGETAITGKDTLTGRKVCSVTGSTPIQRVRDLGLTEPQNIVEFPTYSQCIDGLLSGQVDAVTTDDAILKGYAAQAPDQLKVVGEAFTEEPYGIGLNRDDAALRNAINDLLQAAIDDGTWQRIYDGTLGLSGAPADPPQLERY